MQGSFPYQAPILFCSPDRGESKYGKSIKESQDTFKFVTISHCDPDTYKPFHLPYHARLSEQYDEWFKILNTYMIWTLGPLVIFLLIKGMLLRNRDILFLWLAVECQNIYF